MANVKVRFSAMFKDVTGIGETDIEIEGKTVENLIEVLIERFGSDFEQKVIDNDTGEPRRFVNLFVNGRDIRNLSGPDTELDDGDEVRLIPAVAGGKKKIGFTEDYEFAYPGASFPEHGGSGGWGRPSRGPARNSSPSLYLWILVNNLNLP